MTTTVAIKQLNEAERWSAAMLAIEISQTLAKTQGANLSDEEVSIVVDKTNECFAMGITDRWEVLYTCMLHLPYYQDERDSVERLLNAVRGGGLQRSN